MKSGRSVVWPKGSLHGAMPRRGGVVLAGCSMGYAFTFSQKPGMTLRYDRWSSRDQILTSSQMADSPLPEMMRLSLSDLALRIKIMKIKLGTSIEDVLARALDPPASINVQRAVSMLVEVGGSGLLLRTFFVALLLSV